MNKAMTIRISDDMRDRILKICREENVKASNLIREGVRRTIAVHEFKLLKMKTQKHSEKEGFLLDEDIFRSIS